MAPMEVVGFSELTTLLSYADKQIINNVHIDSGNLNTIKKSIDWIKLSRHFKLTENFLTKYQRELSWIDLWKYQRVSHEFLRNNLSKMYLHRDIVSAFQHLTELIMDEFADLLNWDILSKYQQMSEAFVEKNAHRVNWENIFLHQHLSREFREKHKDRVEASVLENIEAGIDEVDFVASDYSPRN